MFRIEEKTLVLANGRRFTCDDFIAEAIPFEETIIIRLENQGLKRSNENVIAIDYNGRFRWRIPLRPHNFSESPYVNIYRRSDFLDAYNWDGRVLTLDPRTGTTESEGWVGVATRGTHELKPRQWM
jgi:hypothetical protein